MKKSSFLNYLPATVIITVIFGVIYTTVQQSYRTAANDPKIQIARDINTRLLKGRPVEIRDSDLVTMVFLGWLICIGFVLLHALLQFYHSGQDKF